MYTEMLDRECSPLAPPTAYAARSFCKSSASCHIRPNLLICTIRKKHVSGVRRTCAAHTAYARIGESGMDELYWRASARKRRDESAMGDGLRHTGRDGKRSPGFTSFLGRRVLTAYAEFVERLGPGYLSRTRLSVLLTDVPSRGTSSDRPRVTMLEPVGYHVRSSASRGPICPWLPRSIALIKSMRWKRRRHIPPYSARNRAMLPGKIRPYIT